MSLSARWYAQTAPIAGMFTLTAGLAVIAINWPSATEPETPLTPEGPATYVARTGTRAPIAGDIIVTDGTQFGAVSEKDAREAQEGNDSGQITNSKYLGFNRHLLVLSVGDTLVRVRVVEFDEEYWLTRRAVWGNVH